MLKSSVWVDAGSVPVNTLITTANNTTISARREGTATISFEEGGASVRLSRALHVQGITNNLISVSALCRDGYNVAFGGNNCVIRKDGNIVGPAHSKKVLTCLTYETYPRSSTFPSQARSAWSTYGMRTKVKRIRNSSVR